MSSDVYIKDQLPPLLAKLIEEGYVRPDGTYIGFDEMKPYKVAVIKGTTTCPHCGYKGELSDFKLIDKDQILLECPECKKNALFP